MADAADAIEVVDAELEAALEKAGLEFDGDALIQQTGEQADFCEHYTNDGSVCVSIHKSGHWALSVVLTHSKTENPREELIRFLSDKDFNQHGEPELLDRLARSAFGWFFRVEAKAN